MKRLGQRWADLDRGERRLLLALAALLAAGLVLRAWLTVAWRPAFLGYPDTEAYLRVAASVLYGDTFRLTAVYGLFLRAVHAMADELTAVVVVQHLLGVASALLLFGAARRVVRPAWAALLPTAVVLLSGTQIYIEHAVLTESLFIAVQAAAVYALVRALEGAHWAWAVAAGLLAATAATVRVAGLVLVPTFALALLLAPQGAWRRRALHAGAAGAAAVVVLVVAMAVHEQKTGQFGLTRAGTWNLYARAAVFADCSRFDEPAGTEPLCEARPPEQRPGPNHYNFGEAESPGIRAFGGPFRATRDQTEKVTAFARAAIAGQPLDYAEAVARDLARYLDSDTHFRAGQGLPAESLVRDFLLQPASLPLQPYWATQGYAVRSGLLAPLNTWERISRIEGPLFVALLALALAGPLLARGRRRYLAIILLVLALEAMVVPVVTYMYDARFAVPAFGLLAVAAAVGLGELGERLRARRAAAGAP